MPSSANLLEGVARIFVGTANSDVLPADTVAIGGSWGGAWRDLGYTTEDGVSIAMNQTTVPVPSGQTRTPVHYLQGTVEDIISCTLTEATLLNIKLVAGRGAITTVAPGGSPGHDLLTLGDATAVNFVAIGFEGVAPPNTKSNPRRILFPKALSTASVTYNQRTGAVAGIPAQFSRVGGTGNDMQWLDVTTV
jgi:hypothetical protein